MVLRTSLLKEEGYKNAVNVACDKVTLIAQSKILGLKPNLSFCAVGLEELTEIYESSLFSIL